VDTKICKQLEELYPAFALDAVDPSERAKIEQHIAVCPACAHIVAEYRPVAEALAFAAPQVEPPADLKYHVLAAALPKAQSPTWFANWAAWFGNLLRAPVFSAVALVLVVALALWNVSLQNQLAQQAAFNQQITFELNRQRALISTIAYADTQPKRLQATEMAPQAVGRLFTAPELNALALIVYDLPVLDSSRAYQIWLIEPTGDRTSGGTFTVDERGRGWVYVRSPKPLDQYQGIGITIEPAGGSPGPTGPKMMGASF
jgi:anti-sigma-K factor RskA